LPLVHGKISGTFFDPADSLNCASRLTDLLGCSYEDFLAQFETNVFGVIKVTRALLPHLRNRRSGTLVFMGSRSGWYGDAFCGAYAGSKFALEGIVESLRWEVEPFGIKTLLVEPGRFRTPFLFSGGNLRRAEPGVADYRQAYQGFLAYLALEDGNQPGDVRKGVSVILDLVRKEGLAKDREVPFRVPLGADCYGTIEEECEKTLSTLRDWEAVTKATDY
jgi:NAD(P)-dependent dehydrogenase (short-subunit alcohol dehydrogenase family)